MVRKQSTFQIQPAGRLGNCEVRAAGWGSINTQPGLHLDVLAAATTPT
jgi:hypothetical protein